MPTVKEGVSNVRGMVNPDGLTVCGLSSPQQRKPKQCRRLGVFSIILQVTKTIFPKRLELPELGDSNVHREVGI